MSGDRPPRVALETLSLDAIPDAAVPAYEAALAAACRTVALFLDDATGLWRVEGVRERGGTGDDAALTASLALAAAVSGHDAGPPARAPVEAEGWLARTVEAFPEMAIGTRWIVRPSHVPDRREWGRTVLRLDAGIAFGSGEHASTRGCLLAFERLARGARGRRARRVLDLGTGSGILAMAAAKASPAARVLATDIEPWSVRVAADNARANGIAPRRLRARVADGWRDRRVRAGRYDLVFANILARPLCAMARDLSTHLAPGGVAVLAGLLGTQARMVLAAHRRRGLVLARRLDVGPWATLVVSPGRAASPPPGIGPRQR